MRNASSAGEVANNMYVDDSNDGSGGSDTGTSSVVATVSTTLLVVVILALVVALATRSAKGQAMLAKVRKPGGEKRGADGRKSGESRKLPPRRGSRLRKLSLPHPLA